MNSTPLQILWRWNSFITNTTSQLCIQMWYRRDRPITNCLLCFFFSFCLYLSLVFTLIHLQILGMNLSWIFLLLCPLPPDTTSHISLQLFLVGDRPLSFITCVFFSFIFIFSSFYLVFSCDLLANWLFLLHCSFLD